MTHRVHLLLPGDPWPPALSNGLTSPCLRCGVVPRFDYAVADNAWSRVVPEEWQPGVVCLPCFDVLAESMGEHLAGKIERISFAGYDFVTEFVPGISHDHGDWGARGTN